MHLNLQPRRAQSYTKETNPNTRSFSAEIRSSCSTLLAIKCFCLCVALASLLQSTAHSLPAGLRANSSRCAYAQDRPALEIPEHMESHAFLIPLPAGALHPLRNEHRLPRPLRVHYRTARNRSDRSRRMRILPTLRARSLEPAIRSRSKLPHPRSNRRLRTSVLANSCAARRRRSATRGGCLLPTVPKSSSPRAAVREHRCGSRQRLRRNVPVS